MSWKESLPDSASQGGTHVCSPDAARSLIYRNLYADGHRLFETAQLAPDGQKEICAVLVGLGQYGTQMLKTLAWFGQMDGYRITIHAFEKDPQAEEKFTAQAPELMSKAYNGVVLEGEARYTIRIYSGIDAEADSFADALSCISGVTYVMVALGSDARNICTAENIGKQLEILGCRPWIQTIVYDQHYPMPTCGIQVLAGCDVQDLRGTQLEQEALQRHLKWGEEATFWSSAYHYRSSMASALHLHLRKRLGIVGANKTEKNLTPEERDAMELLEHRRWNAYMRSEGYVFSGSKDPSSRNDSGKMHHNLVDFASLSEEDKRKDSRVGTD